MELPESRAVEDSSQERVQHKLGIKNRLALVGQGGVGGLIASLCCIVPAVVVAIGLSGGIASGLVSLPRFRLYGLIGGLAFVAFMSWRRLRRRRSCCTEEQHKRLKITVPLTMLASFGTVYMLIMYLFLPLFYRVG